MIEPVHEDEHAEAARMLEDHPEVRVEIGGHTDRVEIGGHTDDVGDRAHDEQRSRDRAQAVADWMVGPGSMAAGSACAAVG